MLIENQTVQMIWATRNKRMYMQKGYTFTKLGDTFEVRVEDLSKGSKAKIKVKCDYCGKIINVIWGDYLRCKDNEYACKKCRQRKTSDKNLFVRQEYLYSSALNFCKSKGYTFLTKINDIKNSETRVYYECLKHGVHNSKIYSLLLGFGCPKCAYEEKGANRRLSIEQIDEEISQYGGIWVNKDEYQGWRIKNLIILCPICGKPFTTSYNSYVKRGGQFCSECSKCKSKGEKTISIFLEKNNILFVTEHRFEDCRDKYSLPFDFYLPDLNVCIEFHGIQHYEPVNHFGGNTTFARQKKHDDIKSNYCKNNNIKLITIPYWDISNIESILRDELFISHDDIV